jgi:hypothetical protein
MNGGRKVSMGKLTLTGPAVLFAFAILMLV